MCDGSYRRIQSVLVRDDETQATCKEDQEPGEEARCGVPRREHGTLENVGSLIVHRL